MPLFAKPELKWREPQAFRRAERKCLFMKFPWLKPVLVSTAMGLLFSFIVGSLLWLNWVLPAPFEPKTRHGLNAIPGVFLFGFGLYYFISCLEIWLPNEIWVFNNKIVVTNKRAFAFHEIKSCMVHDFSEFLVIVLEISGKSEKCLGAPPDLDVAALREIFEKQSIEIKFACQKLYWPEEPAIQQLGHLISEAGRNVVLKKPNRFARPFTVRSLMLWVLILGTLFGTCLRLRNDLENNFVRFEQQIADRDKLVAKAQEAKQASGENWPVVQADHIRGIRKQNELVEQTKNQIIFWAVVAMFVAIMFYFLTPTAIIFWLVSRKLNGNSLRMEAAQSLNNPLDLH